MASPIQNSTLEEWLRRCAAREPLALRELYVQAAPQLLAILMRLLRTRAAAEDALQEVFIRIWQRAGQYEEFKGRALSWMVAIARNYAVDLLRTTRPTVLLEVAELAGAAQLQVAGPGEHAEFGAATATLRRCMQLLAEAQRQCLVLAYQSGLTQERIAQSLSQPLGTVKTWMRRALQSLRTCMES